MARWLVKTEPETYSFDMLERDGRTRWDLVRNYQARNHLKAMRVGEQAFVYHSVGPREIVGVCEVVAEHYPDPLAPAEGEPPDRWVAVDVAPVRRLPRPVSLDQLKEHPLLAGMVLIRQSRLSVCPVNDDEWAAILALAHGAPAATTTTATTTKATTKKATTKKATTKKATTTKATTKKATTKKATTTQATTKKATTKKATTKKAVRS
jgi:predicted RNA-binding protein with PUA-like domain